MRSPSFMAIDDIGTLDRALDDVSLEAAGAAFKLMVKTFIRGKAFADDEAAARALYMQVRRLCRVKDQFDGLFEFAAELVTKARRRFECRAKSELNSNLSPKNQAKSTPPAQKKKDISPISMGDLSTATSADTEPPPPSENTRASSNARPKRRSGRPPNSIVNKRAHRRRRNTPRKTPITAWQPSQADLDFPISKGLSYDRVQDTLDEFTKSCLRDGRHYSDWSAAWHCWVYGALRFAARAAAGARRQPTSVVAAMRAVRAAREVRASFG